MDSAKYMNLQKKVRQLSELKSTADRLTADRKSARESLEELTRRRKFNDCDLLGMFLPRGDRNKCLFATESIVKKYYERLATECRDVFLGELETIVAELLEEYEKLGEEDSA